MSLIKILSFISIILFSCTQKPVKNKTVPPTIFSPYTIDTVSMSSILKYKIDTFFEHRLKKSKLSGQFLFAEKNHVYLNSFGKSRTETSKDIQNDDVFQIASVSKFITAICILKLVELKKLVLTDSVKKYLPQFNYSSITIYQLLTHTSGLPEYHYLSDSAWANDSSIKTIADAFELLNMRHKEAYYAPGSRFNYCNSNYMLLAHIAEKITSWSFAKIVDTFIAKPLGLKYLHVYQPNKKKLLDYNVCGLRGNQTYIPDDCLNQISGDKSIFTNVYDLFLVQRALIDKKIISAKYLKLILAPQVQYKFVNPQFYSFGLRQVRLENGEKWHFHNGWWHGFRTYFWFNIEKEKTVILFTNRLKGGFFNTQEMIGLLENSH